MHRTPDIEVILCVQMVSETFRPPFPNSPLKRLVCMEMNKNFPNFPTYRGSPFIETPLI